VDGDKVTLPALQAMKRAGQKIVGVVAWDFQTARILDRAGVDIVSVGDSVGVNLWGREDESDVTLDELILVCAAVKRGVGRALVSCDLPRGHGVGAARRLIDEGGADVVKVEDEDGVPGYVGAGVPVFAQFSGGAPGVDAVALARRLEEEGASLLDFRHSGPVEGPEVVAAVAIPVIGGLGGGPWLDGRMRLIHRAIGAAAEALDEPPDSYANVAQVTYDAVAAYAADVRGGRQVRGG
jgi:3-methyl-2-oxobutanoate hydroxymethyltransferase